jgi:predicted ABC-type ATPase
MTSGLSESLNTILDRRPIVIAIAGPNGAGKSTFYNAHLRPGGLPFVNADLLAAGMSLDPYAAASAADGIRRSLMDQGASFVFETVFSDPAGDKLQFLQSAEARGYTVVLIFIGVASAEISDTRVAMRVMKGGHDVPAEKIFQRYPRVLENLKSALSLLDNVYVLDNSNLATPFQLLAHFERQRAVTLQTPFPVWLRNLLTPQGPGNL